jgi:hypothetical protein
MTKLQGLGGVGGGGEGGGGRLLVTQQAYSLNGNFIEQGRFNIF